MNLLSQRRVDQVVDVAPERIWVHLRKILATTNEFGRARAGSRQGAKLSHRRTVASNDEAFAVLDAAQDFSPIIPEIAHRHRVHMASVSPVRQQRERHSRTNAGREYAAVRYARGTAWLFLLDGFGLTDYVVEGNGRVNPFFIR